MSTGVPKTRLITMHTATYDVKVKHFKIQHLNKNSEVKHTPPFLFFSSIVLTE